MAAAEDVRMLIAARAARELRDGEVANLGAGIPMLVANYIPAGVDVVIQSENGVVRGWTDLGTRHGRPQPQERRQPPDRAHAGRLLRGQHRLLRPHPRRSRGRDHVGDPAGGRGG